MSGPDLNTEARRDNTNRDADARDAHGQQHGNGISAVEDLMREHGVLKRILLVYEDAISRIDAHQELSPDALRAAAIVVRNFVEDYHERLEEEYLFPRFEAARHLIELTTTLRAQHQVGRLITDAVIRSATVDALRNLDQAAKLREMSRRFVRMYAPHEAREDTVLFPALGAIVSKHEIAAMGEDFERREHDLFGEDGFQRIVADVASIERAVGIYDLALFTPDM